MQVSMLSDQELIQLYLTGNDRAFETLLNRHKTKIYTSIYLFTRDNEITEDIFQEVFIKIIDTLRKADTIMKVSFTMGYAHFLQYIAWINSVVPNAAAM